MFNNERTVACIYSDNPSLRDIDMDLVIEHPINRKRHVALISTLVAIAAAIWGAVASAQAVTIQENTVGSCSMQGTVDSNYSSFTGSGFATQMMPSGAASTGVSTYRPAASISWSFAVPTARTTGRAA